MYLFDLKSMGFVESVKSRFRCIILYNINLGIDFFIIERIIISGVKIGKDFNMGNLGESIDFLQN